MIKHTRTGSQPTTALASAATVGAVSIRAPSQRHMEVLVDLYGADLKGDASLGVEGHFWEEVGVCQVAQLHVGCHVKGQPATNKAFLSAADHKPHEKFHLVRMKHLF